jgi:hypothetical protein
VALLLLAQEVIAELILYSVQLHLLAAVEAVEEVAVALLAQDAMAVPVVEQHLPAQPELERQDKGIMVEPATVKVMAVEAVVARGRLVAARHLAMLGQVEATVLLLALPDHQ